MVSRINTDGEKGIEKYQKYQMTCCYWLFETDNAVSNCHAASNIVDERCSVDKTMELPDLKTNINKSLFWSFLTTRSCMLNKNGLMDSWANIDMGLSSINFICSWYIWPLIDVGHLCDVTNQIKMVQ